MNWIISGFHNKSHFKIIDNLVQKYPVEEIHYFCAKIENKFSKEIKKYYYLDAPINHYANYEFTEPITPLDSDLICELAFCEITTLKMMDRLESLPEFLNHEYRKMIYLKHLRYWNHIFKTKRIDLIIFDNIPHQIYDYIVFCLSKKYDVKSIILVQTILPDCVLHVDDIEEQSIDLKNKYKELQIKYKELDEQEIILLPKYNEYLNHQTDKIKDKTPFYITQQKKKEPIIKRLIRISKSILNGSIKLNPFWISKMLRITRENSRFLSYYDKKTSEPDFDEPYVYIALHYQPEMTTCPCAGPFVDQINIVHMIAYNLPPNVKLYVKEHPLQRNIGRLTEFYDELLKIPNVKLISRSVSTFKLIDHSIFVVTATGTVGWEALFYSKPVLIFGGTFYQYMKGVFKIKKSEECSKIIQKILNKEVELATLKDIKIYLKAIEEIEINGYIDNVYKTISHLTEEENLINLTSAIDNLINSFHISSLDQLKM